MWTKIAENTGTTGLGDLARYEGDMKEGARGKLSLNLRTSIPPEIPSGIETALTSAGVKGVDVTASGSTLNIYFRKGFGWLAVIAAIILGSILLAALIVSWQLWQDTVEVVNPVTLNILLIVGAIVVLFIIWKWGGIKAPSFGGVK